jgi:hypothetical protein
MKAIIYYKAEPGTKVSYGLEMDTLDLKGLLRDFDNYKAHGQPQKVAYSFYIIQDDKNRTRELIILEFSKISDIQSVL